MMPDLPDFMKAYVSDYQMKLVEVLNTETEYFQNEDVKLLFAYSQAFMQKDKARIEELNEKGENKFSPSVSVISPLQASEITRLKYDVKKDVVHMIGKI